MRQLWREIRGTLKARRLLGFAASLFCIAAVPSASAAATPGTLTANFASTGGGTRLFAAAAQNDGKTVAVGESGAGSASTLLLARYTTSGALDSSFGSGGQVHGPAVVTALGTGSLGRGVAVQPDGKIVVVGKASSPDGSFRGGLLVERFNATGSLDGGFGSGGVVKLLATSAGDGYGIALQSDGKIVVSGSADAIGSGGSTPRVAVARLNANGSPDGSFGAAGIDVIDLGSFSYALAVAVQPNGSIVIAGSQSPGGQVVNGLIARLTPAGALDHSFAGSGAVARMYARGGAASSAFAAVAVQPDGKIVAAGSATDGTSGADSVLVRFTSTGAQDGGFGAGGVVYTPSALNLLLTAGETVPGATALGLTSNGDIVTAGVVVNGLTKFGALDAYTSSGSPVSTFGNGGAVLATGAAGANTEAAGLAVAPDGSLSVVGDTSAVASSAFSGFGARYVGLGSSVVTPPALTVSVSGVGRNYKTRTISSRGLGLKVGCNEACKIHVSLVASAGTARQLNLRTTMRRCTKRHGKTKCTTTKGFSQITVASVNATLGGAGTRSLVLRLSRGVARAAGRQKSVKLSLQISVSSSVMRKTITSSSTVFFKR